MELKRCGTCGNEYPKTIEYFGKLSRSKDGFRGTCKECRRQEALRRLPQRKIYIKEYYAKNSDAIKEHVKTWRTENPEKASETSRTWRQNNKEHCKIMDHNKYIRNKDKRYEQSLIWQANNPEKVKAYRKTYRKNNKLKIANDTQKRRTLKLSLPSTFTNKDWAKCKEDFNHECAYCGSKEKLTREHFVPLSKGGEYTKDNVIPVCLSCNSSKANRDFFEWYKSKPFYSQQREQKILKYLNYKNKTQQLTLI